MQVCEGKRRNLHAQTVLRHTEAVACVESARHLLSRSDTKHLAPIKDVLFGRE